MIDDRLFACVGNRIIDVTAGGSTPPAGLTVSNVSDSFWHSTQFQTSTNNFLCAVNNGGGFWTYDPVNGWVKRTLTGGPANIDNITSVSVWKKRLLFTFANDSRFYYLAPEAISGALSPFDLGPQMKHGGTLVATTSFTRDGGSDIEDYLVAFGSEGDVIVYAGYDPSNAANFQLVGSWYVGPFPRRPTFYATVGSDLYILCETGIVPLSMLVGGRWNPAVLQNPITGKIEAPLRDSLVRTRYDDRWEVFTIPALGILVLKQPRQTLPYHLMWVMNIGTGAWSNFNDVPAHSCAVLRDTFYFGTTDGRVARAFSSDLASDGILLNGTGGSVIEATIQAAFLSFGNGGQLKKFEMARPVFIAPSAPVVAVKMNNQFNDSAPPGSPAYTPPSGSRWDVSLW
ncbi:MAG: hypothetical protein NZ518_10315, partial [Dehalococcoidia bacterium]|nr:hypothetical protein [Dehalococcoidia bacterium]